ncbi:MAG: DUF4433 domain-containing protein [Flavobacteriales bacterium]|nr:DUF4433 domain-containing protein [Flavobacteriales bacterium]
MPAAVPERINLFRMVHHANIAHILEHGLCNRSHPQFDPAYVDIGHPDIVGKRTAQPVGIEGYGDLGEYVPFYFCGHTPMLLNIITGKYGLPKRSQRDLVFIHCPMQRILDKGCRYFYTDGNAKVNISKTYTTIGDMDQLDWEAIGSYDFRIAEHGPDRIRRKHAEFLVHGHVPVACIAALLVLDTERKAEMEALVTERDLDIKVMVDQQRKWFFS